MAESKGVKRLNESSPEELNEKRKRLNIYIYEEIRKFEYKTLSDVILKQSNMRDTYLNAIPNDIYQNYIKQSISPMFAIYNRYILFPCCKTYSQAYQCSGRVHTWIQNDYNLITCDICNIGFIYRQSGINKLNNCLYIVGMEYHFEYRSTRVYHPVNSYFLQDAFENFHKRISGDDVCNCIVIENGVRIKVRLEK